MASHPDAVLRELGGLRALARALVAGGPDADDLLQDTAIAALEHPPATDRPVRPWLAAVLRNRRRMDARAETRRQRRELAAIAADDAIRSDDAIDRARALERLSRALVALDEPFRTAVVRRYLDGESSAAIARALGVPAGTVRWRLKTGLERLRVALDADSPDWRRALVPLAPYVKGALLVKLKLSLFALLVLLIAGGVWLGVHRSKPAPIATPTTASKPKVSPLAFAHLQPGQARPSADATALPGGEISGRVINWSTGEGVADADVTFTSTAGAVTLRTDKAGGFELAPAEPGVYTLSVIAATGFLPYAPELEHSPIHVAFQKGRSVGGLTVFVYPALDYHGVVVDAANAPVAGAHVTLVGTPNGEQALDRVATEWTTGADGTFTFHGPDDAVFEAVKGAQRGWARLDGGVAITKRLVIKVGAAAARTATITGIVVDETDQPLADALVRALPVEPKSPSPARAPAFATSAPDGSFTLEHLDTGAYDLLGEVSGRAATRLRVDGGTANVKLAITAGIALAGTVATAADTPVPAFTLTVMRRDGAARNLELATSIVDPRGHFEVHITPGDVELIATAAGWAPTMPVRVSATTARADLKLVVQAGATITGKVADSATGAAIPYARVMRETLGGGASAQPSNVGTVTRTDGTFELTGVPAGATSITIDADSYHPKIEGGLLAKDGETLGPLAIPLTVLAPGEEPTLELVGIGVALGADGDGLRVQRVIAGGGAEAAGVVTGDLVVAVDGMAASELGVQGAVAKIRGIEGTTVQISLRRGDQVVTLVCERHKLRA